MFHRCNKPVRGSGKINLEKAYAYLIQELAERSEWEASSVAREAEFSSLLRQLAELQEAKTAAEIALTRKSMELDSQRLKMDDLRDKLAALQRQLAEAREELRYAWLISFTR